MPLVKDDMVGYHTSVEFLPLRCWLLLWRVVRFDMKKIEGLLTIVYALCELQYRRLLLTVVCYCLLHIVAVGFNGGNYCLLFLIIAHYFGGWL